MLSRKTAESLGILLVAIQGEVAADYSRALGSFVVKMVGQGALHSSGFTLTADQMAADAMNQAGARILAETLAVHEAEPHEDTAGRAAQLSESVTRALERTGTRLADIRDERLRPIQGMPRGRALEQSMAAVSARTLARLHIQLTASENRHRGRSTTINVTGPVGALQTGDNASASVVQTVQVPSSNDALDAINRIEAALREVAGAVADSDVLEMVGDLREQASRERPNPIKVSTLVGGVGSVIQTIPNIGPAWATVLTWSAVVRDAARAVTGG